MARPESVSTAREWLSDYQGGQSPGGRAQPGRGGRNASENENIFGNAASAVNDGWSQFSSFLGGGLGSVFRQPSPPQAAGKAPAAVAPSHAAPPGARDPSSRQPVASALRNPLRTSATDAPAGHEHDAAPSHQSSTGGRSLGAVQSFMGSIASPCVPVKDHGPAIMVPVAEVPDVQMAEAWASGVPASIGGPQAAGFPTAHASPAQPQQANRNNQTAPPMPQPLGKFRAGQNHWTVVNDEPSKPKEQMGIRNQVAAVECIKTNDFTIVADVGFAQADGSRKVVEGGQSTVQPRPSERTPASRGEVLQKRLGSEVFETPQDIFNKMYPISAKDIQHRIAGASPSSVVDGGSPSASPPKMTSPVDRWSLPAGNGRGILGELGDRGRGKEMYATAPRHSNGNINLFSTASPALATTDGFVPDLQMDDSFQSVMSPPDTSVVDSMGYRSQPMLQKGTSSFKMLPSLPVDPAGTGETMHPSQVSHTETPIKNQHTSTRPDAKQLWLPEMGSPPPGLRLSSSGNSPNQRQASPMRHGHSTLTTWAALSQRGTTVPAEGSSRSTSSIPPTSLQRPGVDGNGSNSTAAIQAQRNLYSTGQIEAALPASAQVSAARTELRSRSPVDTHTPLMQAAELKNSAARPLHSTHSGAVLEEERGVEGARSASRRVEICGDRASLKADPARPVFVPALKFPHNIKQDSDDEDEKLGTAVMVPQGGHSSLNAPKQKHQQHPHVHHHPNQMPQQKQVPQNSNTVNFVKASTAHSQTLHASMPARPRSGGGALADAPTSPAVDIHRSLQPTPNAPGSSSKKPRPLLMRQRYDMIQARRGTVTPDPKRPSVVPTLKLENIVPSDDSEDDEYVPAPKTPVQKKALSPPLPAPVQLHSSLRPTAVKTG